MLNDFLIWLGWSVDNTFWPPDTAASFWHSPLGLFCTLVLTLTSIIRVMHYKTNPGPFDTFWHFCMSMTCGAGFMIGLHGTPSHHLVKTLIVLMTIRGIYKCIGIFRNDSCKAKRVN